MGLAETQSDSSHFIKRSMRDALKKMAYMSQIAKCISLIPKPEDFATQIAGEVVTLISQMNDVVNKFNSMVDGYSKLPLDFLVQSADNLMTGINTLVNDGGTMINNQLDALRDVNASVATIVNEGIAVTNEVLDNFSYGQTDDVKEQINTAQDVISHKIYDDGLNTAQSYVEKGMNKANEAHDKLNKTINELIEKINKITDDIYKTVNIPSNKMDSATSTLNNAAENITVGGPVGGIATGTIDLAVNIVENFDIGKMLKSLTVISTDLIAMSLGLDELPPINIDAALAFGKSKMQEIKGVIHDDAVEYYESDEYKRIVEECEENNKKIRQEIRKGRKKTIKEIRKKQTPEEKNEERKNHKSVRKEIRKRKNAARKARMSAKYLDILKLELSRMGENFKMFGTNIKDDWYMMEEQYKHAVEEIKQFFTGDPNEAPGSKYIDDCCDAIEEDCGNIKSMFSNIGEMVTFAVAKVPAPSSVGAMVMDNPLYKVLDWFEQVKVIFNTIQQMIGYGIDIIRQVNNIVKIILNGINSLADIKEQIMDILGIKWILDLIDSLVELFSKKCAEGKELAENTISPIYYKDTEECEETLEAINDMIDNNNLSNISVRDWGYRTEKYVPLFTDTFIQNFDNDSEKDMEKFDEIVSELENTIVAYKSPLLNDEGTEFIGWVYYYPTLDEYYTSGVRKKWARRIMKRASETGHRVKGGKNKLLRKTVHLGSSEQVPDINGQHKLSAYDAFYWYTKWTSDPTNEDADFQNTGNDVVSPITTTENGTLVKLEDGRRVFVNDFGIKSGDYVNVEGKRYRVL